MNLGEKEKGKVGRIAKSPKSEGKGGRYRKKKQLMGKVEVRRQIPIPFI